ncbi:Pheromone M-factor receptor [Wickerhamomyces ciferrii]|uniref:Pheromone M-factor receptor n=1 Tax=Wickerhamomyces ciferrii (strain ATCC 14091 / BCRC 22168 / CBS 111 / JCM 3599 / NBRC 0793 / NRRL Y-1031 F-60-10) TaxID=1206466 RepID=K0KKW7_WICCF|nr:Pheromone M-factor receptor [Wickerhamomyces ciferrii]CCH43656.1 Pheromone M-factor receptor [Wickerhamomyces ciferrii]
MSFPQPNEHYSSILEKSIVKVIELRLLLQKTNDEGPFFNEYKATLSKFTTQLRELELNANHQNQTIHEFDREIGLLYMTNFAIPVKPSYFKSMNPVQFYRDADEIFQLLQMIIRDCKVSKQMKVFILSMFQLSLYYCLSRARLSELAPEISKPFSYKAIGYYPTGRTIVNDPFKDKDKPFYMHAAFKNISNGSTSKIIHAQMLYSSLPFVPMETLAGPKNILKLKSRCTKTINMLTVSRLIREEFLTPILRLLKIHFGVNNLDMMQKDVLIKDQILAISKTTGVPNTVMRCDPSELLLIGQLVKSSFVVIMPVWICEPGTLREHINAFGNCKDKSQRRKSPIQNLICEAVCLLYVSKSRYALITDYNNFLMIYMKEVERGTEGSFEIKQLEQDPPVFMKLDCEYCDSSVSLHSLSSFIINATFAYITKTGVGRELHTNNKIDTGIQKGQSGESSVFEEDPSSKDNKSGDEISNASEDGSIVDGEERSTTESSPSLQNSSGVHFAIPWQYL